MIQYYAVKDSIGTRDYGVDQDVIKRFIRANAHRYGIAKCTNVTSKSNNIFSDLGLAPKARMQAVNWRYVRDRKAQFENNFYHEINKALMLMKAGNIDGVANLRSALYKAYCMRFKAAAQVRQEARSIKTHNYDLVSQVEMLQYRLQQCRDWILIGIAVVPTSGIAAYAVYTTVSVVGTAVAKYQDTNGNLWATGANLTGSLVNVGATFLPERKLVTVGSVLVDGFFEGLEGFLEGKKTQEAINGALIKAGAGASAAGASGLAAQAFKKRMFDEGLIKSASDLSKKGLTFAGSVTAKELGRDPLSGYTAKGAKFEEPVAFEDFIQQCGAAIWIDSVERFGKSAKRRSQDADRLHEL